MTEPTDVKAVTKKPNRTARKPATRKVKVQALIFDDPKLPAVPAQEMMFNLLETFNEPQRRAIADVALLMATPGTEVYQAGFRKMVRYLYGWAKHRAMPFKI